MDAAVMPRPAVVAGRFYPDDAQALRAMVAGYLQNPPQREAVAPGRELLALMLPHAGYVFSGPVAGAALGGLCLPGRVLLLGPNHTGRGAPLSVWSGGPWQTPLGEVPIDTATTAALLASGGGFSGDMQAHVAEHSLEVLLPFLQVLNPAVSITPVTVARLSSAAVRQAGMALGAVLAAAAAAGEGILLLISSDMSHYLPHDETTERDAMALKALQTLDPEHFLAVVQGNAITMCGMFPMAMALTALAGFGDVRADVLAYATSGQTGKAVGAGMDKVVGYAAVAFTR